MDVNLSELREMVMNREAWRAAIHGIAKSQTRLSDWTELNFHVTDFSFCFHLAEGGKEPILGLCYKGTTLIHESSILMSQSLPRSLPPHAMTLGVRFNVYINMMKINA